MGQHKKEETFAVTSNSKLQSSSNEMAQATSYNPPLRDTDRIERPVTAWGTVAILNVFYIFAMLDRQIVSMIVDPIKADLGLTDVQIGLLMGLSFALFYAICALPVGWLVDNKPRRLVIFVGVACWSLATAMSGFARSFYQLFIARMIVGLGEAVLHPAAYSMISDSFPQKRITIAISVFTMGAYFGSAIAILAGGAIADIATTSDVIKLPIVGEFKSWQIVFFLAGLPCLFFSFAIFLVPEPVRKGLADLGKESDVGWLDAWKFIKQRPLLWILFTVGVIQMNIMQNSLILWIPSFISRYHGWSPGEYGPILALIILVPAICGKMFAGVIADHFRAKGIRDIYMRYYVFVIPIAAPLAIYGLMSPEIFVFFGFICFYYFFLSPFHGVAAAAIQTVTPNKLRGKMSSLVLMFTNIIGLGLGPVLVSFIGQEVVKDQVNLGISLSIVVAVCSTTAFLCFFFGLKHLRLAAIDAEKWQ